jgi:hypothetical protein
MEVATLSLILYALFVKCYLTLGVYTNGVLLFLRYLCASKQGGVLLVDPHLLWQSLKKPSTWLKPLREFLFVLCVWPLVIKDLFEDDFYEPYPREADAGGDEE